MFKTRFAKKLAYAVGEAGLPALENGDVDFFWSNLVSVEGALHYLEMRAIRIASSATTMQIALNADHPVSCTASELPAPYYG